MRKVFAVLLAAALLLALTGCRKKEAQTAPDTLPAPVEKEEQSAPAPKLEAAKDVTVAAEIVEGRIPGGEYYLPEELSTMAAWLEEGSVALLAQKGDVRFYGVEGKESNPALFVWGESVAEFDWWYVTPHAIEPELWVGDVDGDSEPEVVVDCYAGSGTGVSLEYIYVVEKTADGTLVSCGLPWETLSASVNEQLRAVSVDGGTYAALGRELVDVSEELERIGAEDAEFFLGQVTRYTPAEEGLSASFGVVAEGDGIPYLSTYVAVAEGTVQYKNGEFTLSDLHLRSY